MYLLHLETENVLGLADGRYDFGKPRRGVLTQATAIHGPSGAGKTSLLAAIVFGRELLGGYGAPEKPETLLRSGAKRGRLRIVFELDEAEIASGKPEDGEAQESSDPARRVDLEVDLAAGAPAPPVSKAHRTLFGRFGEPSARGALEYFPDNRVLDVVGSRTDLEQEKRRRPSRAAQKYAGLAPWLRALAARATPSTREDLLSRLRAALEHLAPGLELRGLSGEETPELVFDFGGAEIPLPNLSSSQRQAVLIAGTVVRFHLETGLILLDQPELSLHSDDHERFVRALAEVAPEAQFIFATGSSGVLAAVPRAQRIQLESRVAPAKLPVPSRSLEGPAPSPPKPAVGPSVLHPAPAPEPSPSPAAAPIPAAAPMPESPPKRESPLFTPSYLQQQAARSPEPYVPMSQAPVPPLQVPSIQQASSFQAPPLQPLAYQTPPAQPPTQPQAPKSLSPENAAVLARMKQGLGDGPVESTAYMEPLPAELVGLRKQLPFSGAPSGSFAPAPDAPQSPPSSPRTPSVQSGRTVAASSGARPSLPFMGRGAPNSVATALPPGWTLQRYAVLCVDLYANQNPRDQVLAHARITPEQHQALDDYWQQRMQEDPAVRAEWKHHADRRQAELQGSRR